MVISEQKGFADYRLISSPNCSSRKGMRIDSAIIHYTAGGSLDGTIRWLTNPSSRVSYHFLISRIGEIVQLVDLDFAAWHAGASIMRIDGKTMRNVANYCTIGIGLCNYGLLTRGDDGLFYHDVGLMTREVRHLASSPVFAELELINGNKVDGWWEPYTNAQLESLDSLLKSLRSAEVFGGRLYGHSDVSVPVGRKLDPGPLFDWRRFGGARIR